MHFKAILHWALFRMFHAGQQHTIGSAAARLGCTPAVARVHFNNLAAARIIKLVAHRREGTRGALSAVFAINNNPAQVESTEKPRLLIRGKQPCQSR